jgi:Rieske Fe-S protein
MMKRRRFVQTFVAALGAAFLWPARLARAGKVAIGLDKLEPLQTVGSSVTFKLKGKMVMLIRDGETSVKGFSPICTHQECTVEHTAGSDSIDCPCHGSTFDLEGRVLTGPAERPLQRFETTLRDGRVVIDLGDE